MPLAKRIIPCLDVDQGRVVKGVNFVGIRDAGDPVEIAKRYNDAGADEITFLDITASHEQRDTLGTAPGITCVPIISAGVPRNSNAIAACSVRRRIAII